MRLVYFENFTQSSIKKAIEGNKVFQGGTRPSEFYMEASLTCANIELLRFMEISINA